MDQVESTSDFDLGASSRTTEELFQGLYSELRRIATCRMARERPGHTLQATALVNEVWLRLSQLRQQTWRDDDHFIAAASETMRRILVDRARNRAARKNGGALRRTQPRNASSLIAARAICSWRISVLASLARKL